MIRLSVNFPFRKKCGSDAARRVRRGYDRHDWSQGCPNAPWTAYGGQVSMSEAKVVHERRGRPMDGRHGQSCRVRDESPSEGRLFGPQGRMRLTGVVGGRRGQVFAFGTKPSREALVRLFAGSRFARPSWRLYHL